MFQPPQHPLTVERAIGRLAAISAATSKARATAKKSRAIRRRCDSKISADVRESPVSLAYGPLACLQGK